MVTFFFCYCGGVRVASRATWRSIIYSSVSSSSSASVAISSDIDAASDAGAGCALSFPFLDAIWIIVFCACLGLLDDGFSTSSSSNKPFGFAGMFIARSIIFGDDVVGVGAARASLHESRGLRIGRRSVLAFDYALIISSNFWISEAMSLFISALRATASAWVNPYSVAATSDVWVTRAGRFFNSLTSSRSSLFCVCNAAISSVVSFNCFTTSSSVK
jgi:hypothetical protein